MEMGRSTTANKQLPLVPLTPPVLLGKGADVPVK